MSSEDHSSVHLFTVIQYIYNKHNPTKGLEIQGAQGVRESTHPVFTGQNLSQTLGVRITTPMKGMEGKPGNCSKETHCQNPKTSEAEQTHSTARALI